LLSTFENELRKPTNQTNKQRNKSKTKQKTNQEINKLSMPVIIT